MLQHNNNSRISSSLTLFGCGLLQRVSAVWFVLLPMLVEHWNDTAPFRLQADKSNMRDLYVVVLHIIENTDRELLRHWWKQQELKHVYTFFNIIKDILSSFEFDPSVTCKATSLMTPQLALFMKAVGTDEMKNLLKGQQSLMHTKDDDIERLVRKPYVMNHHEHACVWLVSFRGGGSCIYLGFC